MQTLDGHNDEIFSCAFNYEGDTIITGSKDNTCRIWTTGEYTFCQCFYLYSDLPFL